MTDGDAMETLSQATTRLMLAGYVEDYRSHDGRLVCEQCETSHDPAELTIDAIVRFEGDSDPDDEAIVYALDAVADIVASTSPPTDPGPPPTTSPSSQRSPIEHAEVERTAMLGGPDRGWLSPGSLGPMVRWSEAEAGGVGAISHGMQPEVGRGHRTDR